MNRVMIALLFVVPLLHADGSDVMPGISEQRPMAYMEDEPIDPQPVLPAQVSIGRGLGDILMTIDVSLFGCDGPGGLSWDGQYLYAVGLISDSVYVIDPIGPTLVNVFPSPPTSSFGIGQAENLWVTCITTDSAYEYTTGGVPTDSLFSCVAGGHLWAAGGSEWWDSGEIWFVNVGPAAGNKIYKFAVPSGAVLDSFMDPAYTYTSQRGISYDPYNDRFWIGGWNSDSIWELNSDGTPTGRTFYLDGCAGVAYDWQSHFHPTPVLWACIQGTDQIVMVDADNPNPLSFFWDFETGEQGWTHTSGGSFPGAWDVVESGYTVGSFTIAPPDPGDSSFCIDGDLGGVCHDTAMSPPVEDIGFSWFKWGMHFQNYSDYQTFTVIMRSHSGGSWNSWVDVWTYTVDTPPGYDSVDISATASDSVQVGFVYDQPNASGNAWFAAFDNVELIPAVVHDVGCYAVLSPPKDSAAVSDHDVIGWLRNMGGSDETFDVVAHVYDTTSMSLIFDQTVSLTLGVGSDTNLNLGQVTFDSNTYYYTEIYSLLVDDVDSSNDTSTVYSRTVLGFPDVIFQLNVQAICNDNQLIGIEFDGERFYLTGGNNSADPNKVYVVDTTGNLIVAYDQPAHSSGWGWRDIAWDDAYTGPYIIDTLYASVDSNIDYFAVDQETGGLVYYGNSPGVQTPNRALAYNPDSGWFYAANIVSDCYRLDKSGAILQTVPNTYAMYGAAYDDGDTLAGPWVWWHSQDDPGSGFDCQLNQMDANTMSFTDVVSGFSLPDSLSDAAAGGLCFFKGFRGTTDVLFALLQGTPVDYIVGIFVRPFQNTGVSGRPGSVPPSRFGFGSNMATVVKNRSSIVYTTTKAGPVLLKVYDIMGRLVKRLVDDYQDVGDKLVVWDNRDLNERRVPNGIYFLKLDAEEKTAVQRIVLVR